MHWQRSVANLGTTAAMIVSAAGGWAQTYPSKPIRIITSAAGSGSDVTSRIVTQGLSGMLGQQLVVDNRTGATPAAEAVAKAAPDGYTLLVAASAFAIMPLLRRTTDDALTVKDFASISLIETATSVVVVHPSLPVRSVKDLIALAKAKPGELNYGATVPGSASHLAVELFKYMTGADLVYVPYKSSAYTLTDLVSGRVQLMFGSTTVVMSHIKSGRLRALAVTSSRPSALVPGLPTVADTVPGYEAVGITGLFAPLKTPNAIIARLNEETGRFLRTAEAKEMFLRIGSEATGGSPEECAAAISAETARMGKVIKEFGIKAD